MIIKKTKFSSQSEYQQTEEKEIVEGSTQTEEELNTFFMEAETQTVEVKEMGTSAETQTYKIETFDKDTTTVVMQTADTEFQTDMVSTREDEVQTWVVEHSDVQTGILLL